jgi:hypothetical protein
MIESFPIVTIHDDDLLYRRLHHTQVYEDGSVKSIAYMVNSRPYTFQHRDCFCKSALTSGA